MYGVVLHAHPVRGESHIQRNTTERLQQHPLLFTTNCTDRTFFVWRLNSAQPSDPGHSTILLRSEIPSGIYAKLRTVAASNNRVHMPWSLYYCLFAPHIRMVLFFTHIPFVVNHTFNATPLRGCNRAILAHVTWPRAQPLGQSVLLKFLLETRLESESFEPLINFLAFLVQRLWSKINNLINYLISQIFLLV